MQSYQGTSNNVTLSLKYKFAIFTSSLILLVCITLSLFLLDKVEEELLRQIHLRGMSTITNFAQNAKYSLTTRDKTFLASLVEHEISKEDVVHVMVVNERAIILGHNNPSKVGQLVEDDYTRNFLESLDRKTVRKITIPTGEMVYDFVMPIMDSDIYNDDRYANPIEARRRMSAQKNLGLIRIGISFRKMEESIKKTYYGVLYISIFIALLSILLAFWYGKILVKPLTAMTHIASRLASGYLDERVKIHSNDEIGLLADNFNSMAISLQESRSNLWKLNKELEYIVEERTAELRTAYRELQQIDQLKSTFLSTVSHELRTPLTSILGFSKIIQKQFKKNIVPNIDSDNSKAIKAQQTIQTNLDIITEESNRLARLINDVLDLAKIESGKMTWNMQSINVASLFEKAIKSIAGIIANPDLEIIMRNETHDLPDIIGDEDRVYQVITNLLSNAIKFTPKGAIICSVQLKDDYVQCYVKDSGTGIAEHDLVRIFDKFQQAGDTLTEKPQGTGLGLPICKEIIEHHKGQIWADSRPGKGSTFYFALPVSSDNPVSENVKEVTFQLQNKLERMEKSEYLILIADEDPGVRNLLQIGLEEQGYRTIQATNGKETYDLAREYPVNAILIDIMMYEVDGFDTPHYLKADKQTSNIPIVLLSIVINRYKQMLLGASSYITTPVNSDKILNRLTEIYRDQELKLVEATAYFYGYPRAIRKHYEIELRNMGLRLDHFDTEAQLKKATLQDPPTIVFVNFRETDSTPNQFFLDFRDKPGLEHLPIVATVHESHIARRIDDAPIKGLSNLVDITNTINELFGKRLIDQTQSSNGRTISE